MQNHNRPDTNLLKPATLNLCNSIFQQRSHCRHLTGCVTDAVLTLKCGQVTENLKWYQWAQLNESDHHSNFVIHIQSVWENCNYFFQDRQPAGWPIVLTVINSKPDISACVSAKLTICLTFLHANQQNSLPLFTVNPTPKAEWAESGFFLVLFYIK